jgi:putative phosphoesterase
MLIGCVSDTHLIGRPVPESVLRAFDGVDLILHAGDILEMAVVEELQVIAEVLAVRGNMDHGEVAARLPDRRVIEAGSFKIGLTHGSGPPSGITWKVARVFEGEECDCIVFGHTHNSLIKERNGVLFFNPGSPTDRMFARHNSVGLLEVTDRIEPRVIYLEKEAKGK